MALTFFAAASVRAQETPSALDPDTGFSVGETGAYGYCCQQSYAASNKGRCLPEGPDVPTASGDVPRYTLTQCELGDDGIEGTYDDGMNYTRKSRKQCNIYCGEDVGLIGCLMYSDNTYSCEDVTEQDYNYYRDDIPAFSPLAPTYDACSLYTTPIACQSSGDCPTFECTNGTCARPLDTAGQEYADEAACRRDRAIQSCQQTCKAPIDAEITVVGACGLGKNIVTVTVENPSQDQDFTVRHIATRLDDFNPCTGADADECADDNHSPYCQWGGGECNLMPDLIKVLSQKVLQSNGEPAPHRIEPKFHDDFLGVSFTGVPDRQNPLSFSTIGVTSLGQSTGGQSGSPTEATVTEAQLSPGVTSFQNFNIPKGGKFEAKISIPAIAQVGTDTYPIGTFKGFLFPVTEDADYTNNEDADLTWSKNGCLATRVTDQCSETYNKREVTVRLSIAGDTRVELDNSDFPLECIEYPEGFVDSGESPSPSPVNVTGCVEGTLQVLDNAELHRAVVRCTVEAPENLWEFNHVDITFPVDAAAAEGCGGLQKSYFSLMRVKYDGTAVDPDEESTNRAIEYTPQFCTLCDRCQYLTSETECIAQENYSYCEWVLDNTFVGPLGPNETEPHKCVPRISLDDPANSMCPIYMACCDKLSDDTKGVMYYGWAEGTANSAASYVDSLNDLEGVLRCSGGAGEGQTYWRGPPPVDNADEPFDPDYPNNKILQRMLSYCDYSYEPPSESTSSASSTAARRQNYYCSGTLYLETLAYLHADLDPPTNCPFYAGGEDQPIDDVPGGGQVFFANAYPEVQDTDPLGSACYNACVEVQQGHCCAEDSCTLSTTCTPGSYFYALGYDENGDLGSDCAEDLRKSKSTAIPVDKQYPCYIAPEFRAAVEAEEAGQRPEAGGQQPVNGGGVALPVGGGGV